MPSPLKICFAASEVAPYAKTGGLADVSAALPRQLHRRGHDVRPFLPLYGSVDRGRHALQRVDFAQNVRVELGPQRSAFSLWTGLLPDSELPVYFVDSPEFFRGPSLYLGDAEDARRFAFFSRAVLTACQYMGWSPDLVHCNDWHTALIPLLLRHAYDWDRLFAGVRTVLTLHNVGYQGYYPSGDLDRIGLAGAAHLLDPDDLSHGRVNFLRTGLIYADLLTTVSPTHAAEIRTPAYGMGLDGVLRARSDRLIGILNGVDDEEWNPERDRYIPHHYSRRRPAGKRRNKTHLLEALGLPDDPGPPLMGVISRFVPQKGFDIAVPVLPEVLARSDLRMAILGSGESRYEDFFRLLQQRFPAQVVYYRGYSNELAHLIEAGSDLFLMPSRYEPCGLNQMFSLRYGTIPVVRRTGGLADSVIPYDAANDRGNGFAFEHFTPQGLHWALELALSVYRDPGRWRRLVRRAMESDFSWTTQSELYVEAYRRLLAPGRAPGGSG
jgi:starch synthase